MQWYLLRGKYDDAPGDVHLVLNTVNVCGIVCPMRCCGGGCGKNSIVYMVKCSCRQAVKVTFWFGQGLARVKPGNDYVCAPILINWDVDNTR